jgi:DNA-binding transcriptional MerR regulator
MTLRIAEVSEQTGVPASTLRYYEQIGLLVPAGRRPNGYRAYSARDVDRLRFITLAKQLELSLDELRELVTAWDTEDCAGVQDRMAVLVRQRLDQTQHRIAAGVALAAQLQLAVSRLAGEHQAGGCDDGCACSVAGAPVGQPAVLPVGRPAVLPVGRPAVLPVELTAAPAQHGAEPTDCSLAAGLVPSQVQDWQRVLGRSTDRVPVPGGVSIGFDRDPDLIAELARLAIAEQDCCRFFSFTLRVDLAGCRLEVTGPAEAADVIAALFGC